MTSRHLRIIERAKIARPIRRRDVIVELEWWEGWANVPASATETGLGATNRCDCTCGQGGSNWTHESAEIDHAVALEREAIAAMVDDWAHGWQTGHDLADMIRNGEHHKGAANG